MQWGGEARQIQKIPAVANSREEKYKMLRQHRIILSADTASEVPQLPERCLSRKAGIVRCCLKKKRKDKQKSITLAKIEKMC